MAKAIEYKKGDKIGNFTFIEICNNINDRRAAISVCNFCGKKEKATIKDFKRNYSCGCERYKVGKENARWIHFEKGDIIGKHNISYLSEDGYKGNNRVIVAKCHCGNKFSILLSSLRTNNTTSCGCLHNMSGIHHHGYRRYSIGDIIGDNKISYVKDALSLNRNRSVIAKCYCGNLFTTKIGALITGNTKSCGCRNKRIHFDFLYDRWCGIKTRCYNKNSKDYNNYGGRGISMYQPWINDVNAFHDYMVSLPRFAEVIEENLTIDRYPDNDGHYVPGNIRWGTKKEQIENQERKQNYQIKINI